MNLKIMEKKRTFPTFTTTSVSLSFLLMLPASYFVTGNVLKYDLGLLPNVSVYPLPPWVVLGGPMIAIGLSLYSYFQFKKHHSESDHPTQKKRNMERLNFFILMSCGKLLIVMIGYTAIENLISH